MLIEAPLSIHIPRATTFSEHQKRSAEKQGADGEAGLIHGWSVALGCEGLGAAVAGRAFLRNLHSL